MLPGCCLGVSGFPARVRLCRCRCADARTAAQVADYSACSELAAAFPTGSRPLRGARPALNGCPATPSDQASRLGFRCRFSGKTWIRHTARRPFALGCRPVSRSAANRGEGRQREQKLNFAPSVHRRFDDAGLSSVFYCVRYTRQYRLLRVASERAAGAVAVLGPRVRTDCRLGAVPDVHRGFAGGAQFLASAYAAQPDRRGLRRSAAKRRHLRSPGRLETIVPRWLTV